MRRSTTRRGIASAVTLVLAGGIGATAYRVTRPPEPVTVDQAIAKFRTLSSSGDTRGSQRAAGRANTAEVEARRSFAAGPVASAARNFTKTAPTAPVPAEGVYVYDTRGYEATDALTGSRHDYPARTTMTVRHTDCGSTATWNPLDTRWDESRLCTESAGVAMRRFTTQHEFFGKTDTQTFDCNAGSLVYRFPPKTGETWSFRCSSGDSAVSSGVTAIGVERVLVGHTMIEAMHLRYRNTLTGRNRGQQTQDRWIAMASGVLVKLTDAGAFVTDGPFGTVNYEERYSLLLTSMDPQR